MAGRGRPAEPGGAGARPHGAPTTLPPVRRGRDRGERVSGEGKGPQWAPPCSFRRLMDASISASASARPTQSAPSTDLPGSRSL